MNRWKRELQLFKTHPQTIAVCSWQRLPWTEWCIKKTKQKSCQTNHSSPCFIPIELCVTSAEWMAACIDRPLCFSEERSICVSCGVVDVAPEWGALTHLCRAAVFLQPQTPLAPHSGNSLYEGCSWSILAFTHTQINKYMLACLQGKLWEEYCTPCHTHK